MFTYLLNSRFKSEILLLEKIWILWNSFRKHRVKNVQHFSYSKPFILHVKKESLRTLFLGIFEIFLGLWFWSRIIFSITNQFYWNEVCCMSQKDTLFLFIFILPFSTNSVMNQTSTSCNDAISVDTSSGLEGSRHVCNSACQWKLLCDIHHFLCYFDTFLFTILWIFILGFAEDWIHRTSQWYSLQLTKYSNCVKVKVAYLCLTLWDPVDYTVHGILQTRILEWAAFPFPRGSSQPGDWTQVSHIAGGFFTSWATREAQEHWSG